MSRIACTAQDEAPISPDGRFGLTGVLVRSECIQKAPDEMHTQKHGSAYPAEDYKIADWCISLPEARVNRNALALVSGWIFSSLLEEPCCARSS